MNENERNDELLQQAARLPRAVAPERDLWSGIEQAINVPATSRRSRWNTVWAQAAAVVLLIGASSALTYTVVTSGENPAVPTLGSDTVLAFEPVAGSFGSQYHLGPEFQDAHRRLESNLEDELARMDPETSTAIRENIATIRSAIKEINVQLASDPDNVLLQELLMNTYQEELSLLITVDQISNAAMRRDDI